MKTPLLAAALCASILAPALADDFSGHLNFGADAVKQSMAGFQAARAAKAAAAAKTPSYKSQAVIEHVLDQMNDGNPVGEPIAAYVRAKKLSIQLDDSLPDAPRVLAPRIAEQAALKMLDGMPACSEKEYMRLSMAVRTWLELGGDRKALPVVDGYNDQAMTPKYKMWLENGSEMTLYKVGEAANTKSVMELSDAAKDPAQRAQFEKANKAFVDFLLSENEWRQSNGFRLQ